MKGVGKQNTVFFITIPLRTPDPTESCAIQGMWNVKHVIHLKYDRRFSLWALYLLPAFSPLVLHFPLPKVIKSRLTYQAFQVQGTGVTEERGGINVSQDGIYRKKGWGTSVWGSVVDYGKILWRRCSRIPGFLLQDSDKYYYLRVRRNYLLFRQLWSKDEVKS